MECTDFAKELYSWHGGFFEAAELFDAAEFGISQAEARAMLPEQRTLLEVARSSLCGRRPSFGNVSRGTKTTGFVGGVYVG